MLTKIRLPTAAMVGGSYVRPCTTLFLVTSYGWPPHALFVARSKQSNLLRESGSTVLATPST